MNAYELFDAAFDSAADGQERTIDYIVGYADGAFNVYCPDHVAQQILDCMAEFERQTDENGEYQNNAWHCIKKPLQEIQL